jgi:hypothetical protein
MEYLEELYDIINNKIIYKDYNIINNVQKDIIIKNRQNINCDNTKFYWHEYMIQGLYAMNEEYYNIEEESYSLLYGEYMFDRAADELYLLPVDLLTDAFEYITNHILTKTCVLCNMSQDFLIDYTNS